ISVGTLFRQHPISVGTLFRLAPCDMVGTLRHECWPGMFREGRARRSRRRRPSLAEGHEPGPVGGRGVNAVALEEFCDGYGGSAELLEDETTFAIWVFEHILGEAGFEKQRPRDAARLENLQSRIVWRQTRARMLPHTIRACQQQPGSDRPPP